MYGFGLIESHEMPGKKANFLLKCPEKGMGTKNFTTNIIA